ncbi:hypothetical protein HN451_10425, partial [archaeon]|nr:hypothetical protein [archaeon]
KQIRSQIQEPVDEEYDSVDNKDTDMEDQSDDNDNTKIESEGDSIYSENTGLNPNSIISPFLDLENNFIISINKNEKGKFNCYYEPPRWMTSRVSSDYKYVLNDMARILSAIAEYFERCQQSFLIDPQLENFIFDGKLNQTNFVKKIRMKNVSFDDTDFSFLKDKIWLVWHDKIFSIKSLFNI